MKRRVPCLAQGLEKETRLGPKAKKYCRPIHFTITISIILAAKFKMMKKLLLVTVLVVSFWQLSAQQNISKTICLDVDSVITALTSDKISNIADYSQELARDYYVSKIQYKGFGQTTYQYGFGSSYVKASVKTKDYTASVKLYEQVLATLKSCYSDYEFKQVDPTEVSFRKAKIKISLKLNHYSDEHSLIFYVADLL